MFLFDDPVVGLTPSARSMPRPRVSTLPPPPPRRPGLLERLMPAPSGLEGLLTEEDLKQARSRGLLGFGLGLLDASGPVVGGPAPSLGQALAQGVRQGYGEFDGATSSALQRHQLGQHMTEQKRILAKRQELAQHLTPVPGETLKQRADRLQQQVMRYVQAGDLESAQTLNGLAIAATQMNQQDNGLEWRSIGGHDVLYDKNGNEIKRVPRTPNPRDPNSPSTAEQLRHQRMFTREQQLADDFRSATKQISEVDSFVGAIEASTAPALAGDAAAQQSILFGIMKLNDPGSAVKEGEYATAENAQGVPERLRNEYNRIIKGGRMSPEAMQRYVDQAQRLKGSWRRKYEGYRDHFEKRAKAWGVDPGNVILDYLTGVKAGGVALPGAASPHRPVGGDASVIRNYLQNR